VYVVVLHLVYCTSLVHCRAASCNHIRTMYQQMTAHERTGNGKTRKKDSNKARKSAGKHAHTRRPPSPSYAGNPSLRSLSSRSRALSAICLKNALAAGSSSASTGRSASFCMWRSVFCFWSYWAFWCATSERMSWTSASVMGIIVGGRLIIGS